MGEEGTGEESLRSSPTPEATAAVDQALAKMPPIFRQVFEAINGGASPADVMKRHDLTANAVTNILNQVNARISAATAAASPAGLNPVMRGDKILGGRPDLALSTNPQMAAIDQIRNESGVPDVRGWEEVQAKADRMLASDYAGTYDSLLGKARNLEQMADHEVAAAKSIIARETLEGRTQSAADRVKLAMLIHGYRDVGTETARSLAIRRDPHLKPAERHAQILAEALFTPDAETRARLRKAGAGQQEDILAGWMRRVDAIKADLLAQGIDLDKSLAAYNERTQAIKQAEAESPRAKAAIEETIRKLTKREKAVIESVRGGALVSKVAFTTGMDADEVKAIYSRFLKDIRSNMTASAKRFLEGSLASSPMDLMGQILNDLGLPPLESIDDTVAGFVDRRNQKPRKPKPAAPKPVAPLATPDMTIDEWAGRPPSTWRSLYETEMKQLGPQSRVSFEEWSAKQFPDTVRTWTSQMDLLKPADRMSLEDWAAQPLSQWKTLFETEMRDLQPQSRVSFEEWAKQAIPEPVKQWQDEMNLLPTADRMTFEEWAAKPRSTETFAAGADMFPTALEPINETTGTFDLNDPLAMKHVIDAFSVARGSLMDAIVEYWRMSVLSGPQTHVVNTGSNLLHSAYNLLPKRLVEAGVNTALSAVGLGSQEAATFGEFRVMAAHLRQAATTAARNALRSWRSESRVFDSFARAEALQLDFTGVGGERFEPAVKGKFGTLMRSISFRPMTAADEFMKAFYGQLEAAAHAHRMAKVEEKLSGDAYEQRVKELVQPGSAAWIRAIDETKRVTFQEDMDGENPQAIHRLDQLAELAKKGRAMPWIGRPLTFFLPFIDTPTNIAKEAIRMSPLGTMLAVIDGTRALKQKVIRGNLTRMEADAAAAKLYDRARLVQDVTNQTMAWAAYFALSGLTKGGDDDKDELPVITGTQPYKSTKRGERDNAYAVMPPQSVRIGNTMFSYARIDPFATALAAMVDMHVAINRNGGLKPGVASEWLSTVKDQMKDKTFLQGMSNLFNAIEDPDRFAERIAAGTVTGFVPNIVRQPIKEADPYVRNSNPRASDGFFTSIAKAVGYSVRPQMAPVKMDVWGNPVLKNRGELVGGAKPTDLAFRIFDPTNLAINPQSDPLDRWIYRYNLQTADSKERIGIQPVDDSLPVKIPGEKKSRSWRSRPRNRPQLPRLPVRRPARSSATTGRRPLSPPKMRTGSSRRWNGRRRSSVESSGWRSWRLFLRISNDLASPSPDRYTASHMNGGEIVVAAVAAGAAGTELVKSATAGITGFLAPWQRKRVKQADREALLADKKADSQFAVLDARVEGTLAEIKMQAEARQELQMIERELNRQQILAIACDSLPDVSTDKCPDHDWMNSFFEGCQDISDANIQELWGRMLAGEVAEPGSFSRRTLQFMRAMSKPEVALLELVSSHLFLPEIFPIGIGIGIKSLREVGPGGLSPDNWKDLEYLGIFTTPTIVEYPDIRWEIEAHGDRYRIICDHKIHIECRVLTPLGKDLIKLCRLKKVVHILTT